MEKITIGRQNCNIVIPNSNVSRTHARMSIAGGQYVFEDLSSNGSLVNGQWVNHDRVVVAPGANILLSGNVPLPWDRVYQLLPIGGSSANGSQETVIQPPIGHNSYPQAPSGEGLNIFVGILCFLVPLIGFVIYFMQKSEKPKSANQAGLIGLVGMLFWTISALSGMG